jgi:putative phosphoribosyl transferase
VRAVLHALAREGSATPHSCRPVAPRDALESLYVDAEQIACLATPEPFVAVGTHYHDFSQTSDREVMRLLREARQSSAMN